MPDRSILDFVRGGTLDAELAALVWLLAEGGLPVHVASAEPRDAVALAGALRPFSPGNEPVTVGGGSLEDVLESTAGEPARLGVVLVLAGGRVAAAHYVRPPLRDAGGHVRPQNPAVLATWDAGLGTFEHFAWGILPDLAERIGEHAGDFEIEQGRRREYLAALVAANMPAGDAARAIDGYRLATHHPSS